MKLSSGQPLVDIFSIARPQGDLELGQPTGGHPPVLAVPLPALHLLQLAEELLPLMTPALTPAKSPEEVRLQWTALQSPLLVSCIL